MDKNRSRRAQLGEDTQTIVHAGSYTSTGGIEVTIAPMVEAARHGTRSYPPEAALPEAMAGTYTTKIAVTNETTLSAARRLAGEGLSVAALNFASARNPGGGWLSGAQAQEESLARASALVTCIEGDPMYVFHKQSGDALYTNSAIYTPGVPVFRDDTGRLLDTPYLLAFITAPAVNAEIVLERDRTRRAEIREAMRARIGRVLAIGAAHGHDALVLGAWGCGVFRNDPQQIAELFAGALRGPFRGTFASIVFAVLDTSQDQRMIGPFVRVFGEAEI
jgi:uncharacterized protein (TIGR02452 family)